MGGTHRIEATEGTPQGGLLSQLLANLLPDDLDSELEKRNLKFVRYADDCNISDNRIIKQQSGVSPEMALRLSKALGRSPESWLAMQDAYDLWVAKKNIKLSAVHKIMLDAA